MFRLSEVYSNSDQNGKDTMIRVLFDIVERDQERIDQLERDIARLKESRQPLNKLAKSPMSWHPYRNGNDAS